MKLFNKKHEIGDDKLRKGDRVLLFFNAPGVFCYVLERDSHYFFYAVSIGRNISLRYWFPDNDHEIMAIRNVMSAIGFVEIPIFTVYNGDEAFARVRGGRELLDNLAIHESEFESFRREQAEKAEPKQPKSDGVVSAEAVQPGKVVSINKNAQPGVSEV